ncbi:hypothetical protein [Natronorarus salvus]|uniref:hypothetical protein n=1 Tax=Natronorarus salvus TaxID=3117733 RepID=UPI002F265743
MTPDDASGMLLRDVDFDILEELSDGRRNVGANIAGLTDWERSYVNQRLPHLADYRLVRRIGPSEKSGLYEITPRGLAVLELKDVHDHRSPEFEDVVDERADELRDLPRDEGDN